MAKGDKNKVEKAIESQQRASGGNFDRMRPMLDARMMQGFDREDAASNRNMDDYGDIMERYRQAAGGGGGIGFERVGYNRNPELSKALQGYQEFADTGGYSPEDVANMRARGVSPIRATYARGQEAVNRNKALSGGYSPNAPAAQAKMAREMSANLADASTNLEGQLAEMKQRGRLAGLGGLSQNALADLEMQMKADMANQGAGLQAGMYNRGNEMDALRGMTSLYGTTPGAAALFGSQALQKTGQRMELEDMFNRFGQGQTNQRIASSQMPSNFETGYGRFKDIGSMVAGAAGSYGGGWRPQKSRQPVYQSTPLEEFK